MSSQTFAPSGGSAPKPVPVPKPMPARPVKEPKTYRLPRSKGKIPGLVIFIIVVAVVIPAVRSAFDSISSTDDTYWQISYPDVTVEVPLTAFAQVDTARNELLAAAAEKLQPWIDSGQDGVPSSEYLVLDELLSLQSQVAAVLSPTDARARDLFWDWSTALSELVLAEAMLVATPSQESYDARTLAWEEEATAYQALYDYYLQTPSAF